MFNNRSIYEVPNVYLPNRSPSGDIEESSDDYCERMQLILPNIPSEICANWFYKHHRIDINNYAWINYPTVRFQKEKWLTEEVINSRISKNDTVKINKSHYESGFKELRAKRIENYLKKYQTWPEQPILLYNPKN